FSEEKIMFKSPSFYGRPVLFSLCAMLLLISIDSFAQTSRSTGRRSVSARSIPRDTEMKIRLEDEIDTKESRDGDRFTAVVLSPRKYADSVIEGHIAKIDKSGKLKGRTELALSFDRIRLRNGETIRMAAQVEKVYGEDSVKEVDEEGNVKSGSKGKTTAVRTGGGAAVGAIIGGIAGGGKGAAMGAAVGGAAGEGPTAIKGSKKIKWKKGIEI